MKRIYRFVLRKIKKICVMMYMKPILKVQYTRENIIKCGNDYGGFNVVYDILDDINLKRKLIVYSFGIGQDLSFSEAVYKRWNCDIYAFDPTPKSIKYVHSSDMINKKGFHFYKLGISDKEEVGKFHLPKEKYYVPGCLVDNKTVEEVSGSLVAWGGVQEETINVELKTLRKIMDQLGHIHIDLLKMDIEGSEFAVIDEILNSEVVFEELCLEIHNRFFKKGRNLLKNMIRKLNEHGYYICSVSSSLNEITFIRKDNG